MKVLDIDLNTYNSSLMTKKRNASFLLLSVYVIIHFCSYFTRFDYVVLELFFFTLFSFCLKKLYTAYIVGVGFFFITALRYFAIHSDVSGYFAPVYHLLKYYRLIYIPIIIGVFSNLNVVQKRFLIVEILICVCITNIISLYYVSIDDLAIRYRGMKDGIPNDDTYPGIIRFSQVFSSAFLNFILLISIILNKNRTFVIWLFLVLVLNTITLIKSQLMTPILCFCLVVLFYIIFQHYKQKFINFVILVVIPVLLFYKKISELLLGYLDYIKSDFIAKRLEAILNFAISGDGRKYSAINNRMNKIDISLSSFNTSPLFGIGYGKYDSNVVGSHQDWFDILAVSGVLGFVIVLIVIIISSKMVLKTTFNDSDKKAFLAAMIVFLVLGFLDPCLDICIFFAVFVIIPNFSVVFKRRIKC